jgi:hypothetical protein
MFETSVNGMYIFPFRGSIQHDSGFILVQREGKYRVSEIQTSLVGKCCAMGIETFVCLRVSPRIEYTPLYLLSRIVPRTVIWVRNSVASTVSSSCNAWRRQDRVCTVVEIKTIVPTTYILSWLAKVLPII